MCACPCSAKAALVCLKPRLPPPTWRLRMLDTSGAASPSGSFLSLRYTGAYLLLLRSHLLSNSDLIQSLQGPCSGHQGQAATDPNAGEGWGWQRHC